MALQEELISVKRELAEVKEEPVSEDDFNEEDFEGNEEDGRGDEGEEEEEEYIPEEDQRLLKKELKEYEVDEEIEKEERGLRKRELARLRKRRQRERLKKIVSGEETTVSEEGKRKALEVVEKERERKRRQRGGASSKSKAKKVRNREDEEDAAAKLQKKRELDRIRKKKWRESQRKILNSGGDSSTPPPPKKSKAKPNNPPIKNNLDEEELKAKVERRREMDRIRKKKWREELRKIANGEVDSVTEEEREKAAARLAKESRSGRIKGRNEYPKAKKERTVDPTILKLNISVEVDPERKMTPQERRRERTKLRMRKLRELLYKIAKGEEIDKTLTEAERQKLTEKLEQQREANRLKKRELRAKWREEGKNAKGLPYSPLAPRPKRVTEEELTCDVCSKKFKTRQQVRRHRDFKHALERPFLCSTCPRAYASEELLRYHERAHTLGRAFPCEKGCGAFLKTNQSRKTHESKCDGTGTPVRKMSRIYGEVDDNEDYKYVGMTAEEEKRARKRDQNRKYKQRKRMAIQKLVEGGMTLEAARDQIDPLEKREQRLASDRIRLAKTRLQRRRRPNRERGAPLTEEEQLVLQQRRKLWRLRRKLGIQRMLDGGMTMEEIEAKNQTPEQRENRLIQQRINRARAILRKQLERAGVPPEEIKRRTEAINRETYQTSYVFRPYKPRPDRMKRVDPSELSRIEAELEEKHGITKTDALPCVSPQPPKRTFTKNFLKTDLASPERPTTSQSEVNPCIQYSLSSTRSQIHLPHQSISLMVVPPPIIMYPQQQYHSDNSVPQVYGVENPTTLVTSQPTYHSQDNSSAASSHHEFGDSSYYGDEDDNYSPPPSPPPGGEEYQSHATSSHPTPNYTFAHPPPPQIDPNPSQNAYPSDATSSTPAKRPRNRTTSTKPRRHRPYVYQPPKNPNAKTRMKRGEVARQGNAVCDECGQAFANSDTLRAHKKNLHNPNYDVENRTCRLCGEIFKHAWVWHRHYVNTHKKPVIDPKKAHMCEICGDKFATIVSYKRHLHYLHGDGLKKENYFRCPVCPREKLYKEKMGFYNHLKHHHPDYNRGGHDCGICDKSFPNEQAVRKHVKENHPPNQYFECQHCTKVLYTYLGLNFHYGRCTKIGKAERDELRKRVEEKGEVFNVEVMYVPCEFCGRKLTTHSLGRHYRIHHNGKEDNFECSKCGKKFRDRPHWLNHLEEKHKVGLEELMEIGAKLNKKCREGVSTEYLKEVPSRPDRRRRIGGGGGETKGKGGRRRRKEKVESEEDDSEEQQSSDDNTSDEEVPRQLEQRRNKKGAKRKRKITVIAEEDADKISSVDNNK